ncbi:hypothetical protein SLS63_000579 [Diaporthe eres]|uniref:Uncharacterized protein n=1 Tax=Diaporthe eres TaxID=83184 RepID=A0ABR1PS79_DIAER
MLRAEAARAFCCAAWSRPPRNTWSSAARAGAAMTPDDRVLPPTSFRDHLARAMNGAVPVTMLPMGAPSPLVKHSWMLSKQAPISRRVHAPAAAASHSRAPSRCMWIGGSWARAHVDMAWISARGRIVPLSVFSRLMTRVGQS